MISRQVAKLMVSAESGDVQSQALLATCFHEGDGVDRSPPDALYWWQRAALNDHPGAQLMLGVAYHIGTIFEKDIVMAAQWVMRSARQGNPLSVTYWGSLEKELSDEQYQEALKHARRPLQSEDG